MTQESERARIMAGEEQAARRAAEDKCVAAESDLSAARTRLGLLQEEVGRLTQQLEDTQRAAIEGAQAASQLQAALTAELLEARSVLEDTAGEF